MDFKDNPAAASKLLMIGQEIRMAQRRHVVPVTSTIPHVFDELRFLAADGADNDVVYARPWLRAGADPEGEMRGMHPPHQHMADFFLATNTANR